MGDMLGNKDIKGIQERTKLITFSVIVDVMVIQSATGKFLDSHCCNFLGESR
jgi:hypothetical protein